MLERSIKRKSYKMAGGVTTGRVLGVSPLMTLCRGAVKVD